MFQLESSTDEEFQKVYAGIKSDLVNSKKQIPANLLLPLSKVINLENDALNASLLLSFKEDELELLNRKLTNLTQTNTPQPE